MIYGQTTIRWDKARVGRPGAWALKGLRGQGAIPCLAALFLLAACETTKIAPPPPSPPDLCTFYTPWLMSPAAAANETVENLRAHASNNAGHYDKCIANNPKLDPARAGGPR